MYSSISLNKRKVIDPTKQEDITYENYLRLAEAILKNRKDEGGLNLGVKLIDLQDKDEEQQRMQEIDEMRARGQKTECELINERMKVNDSDLSENGAIGIIVTNIKTGKIEEFSSIRKACKWCNIPYHKIRLLFDKDKSKKVRYENLIFEKTNKEIQAKSGRIYFNPEIHNKHNTPWRDEEKAFIVQSRPGMSWNDISLVVGRTADSCGNMLRYIKKSNKIDYYMNLDVSEWEQR